MKDIKKVGFVSLGCPKALVDSEQIITQLRAEGYEISPSYNDADLVIINTCGFIDAAVEESIDSIGEALAENGKVIVTGCLGAKGTIVKDKFPQVLAVTGPHAKDEVMQAVHQHLPMNSDPFVSLIPPQGIKLTPNHYAYLKISEGCNHRCSFCIIPSLRGDLVSRPISDVLTEAENLANAGVKELLVISQDTSAYGVDVKYKSGFWKGQPLKTSMQDLVQALAQFGIWVRLHYVYPYPHVDNIIPLMADGRVLPYLDIPFQHASPTVLKAMKRPASSENTLERIEKWRSICPDITLRSTFIVGFPGETERDFEQLLGFLEIAQLDRVGCFTYSAVDGAKANELGGAIPEHVKKERLEQFMILQADISSAKLQRKITSIQTVIVDEVTNEGIVARSVADAPEIDGLVLIDIDESQTGDPKLVTAKPGDFITVQITDANEHDLFAKLK
jgi:ribosomal protein S12 methylthiotransferase